MKQGNLGSEGQQGESYSELLPSKPLNQDELLKPPLFLTLDFRDPQMHGLFSRRLTFRDIVSK